MSEHSKIEWTDATWHSVRLELCARSSRFAFGVEALGSYPQKSTKLGGEYVDIVVSFGGVTFTPGHWLYSDDDGVLVSREQLVAPADQS
jgi:regulator of RNase E activity RraA